MRCGQCGKPVDKKDKFCMYCGSSAGRFKSIVLSNVMILIMSLISYILFMSCVFFYVFRSEVTSSCTQDIILNILFIGIFFGFAHILSIAASIAAMIIHKRVMSLICMGFTLITAFSTWLWNFWLTVDGVNMLDSPIFVTALLIHMVLSTVICIFKFKFRILR